MTRLSPRRLDSLDLPAVTISTRRAGELLAHPCGCSRKGCTVGEHLLRSTKALEPGQRAAPLEPSRSNRPDDVIPFPDVDEPADATEGLHDEYRRLVAEAHNAAEALAVFVDRYRPDRTFPLPDTSSDSDWCRVCLNHGICAPRWRSDLCRDCYDWHLTFRFDRPHELIRAKHEGRLITQQMVDDAVRAHRRRHRRRRKVS